MATQPSDSAKQRPRSSPGDELAVIAQRAQAFTNASGAAIALSDSSDDEFVCRARSGSSAPDIGTSLRVEGSFIGLCIQTGKELRCDDAETDTRVDTAAVRSLGIRSMVVTPIREDNRVVGVLAVFAPTPHAFTITHVAVLKTMADQIGALLQKDRRAREESALHPELPVTMPKPVAAAPATAPIPAPVVIKPATPSSAAAAVAPARSISAPAPKVEPIRPAPLAAEIAVPVPFPKREEKRAEPRPEPRSESMAKASFGTLDAVSGEEKKAGGNRLVPIGVVALLLVAAGVWGVMRWRKPSVSPGVQVQNTQNTQTAQSTAPAGTVPAGTQPSSTTTTTADSSASPNPGASTPAASGKPAAIAEKPDTRKTDQAKNSNAGQTTKPAATPATVAFTSGPSRISVGNTQSPTSTPDVAPSLAVGSGSSANLSSLAKPASNSAPTALKQSELVPLQVISKVAPVYPAFARARRVSGPVVVRVTVGKDGKVSNVQFISGPLIFRDAAFEAARQSKYKPALLNGQPIEQPVDMKMNFSPN